MTKSQADLHIHTYYSDSTSSPEQVVEQAIQANLKCFAITDHDTVSGVAPTINVARSTGLEIIPGIELSTQEHKTDLHMLGYGIDITSTSFLKILDQIQDSRVERMEAMIAKLSKLGVGHISMADVQAQTKSRSLGRPHLAHCLVQMGKVTTIKEAFSKYLGDGRPAFVAKNKVSPEEGIKMIRQAGGVAVMAHPMLTRRDEIIPRLVQAGLQGIEVYYANCIPAVIRFYERIATKNGLIRTGGSDDHGEAKKYTHIGKSVVDYEWVERLKQLIDQNKI